MSKDEKEASLSVINNTIEVQVKGKKKTKNKKQKTILFLSIYICIGGHIIE
jgi:hypothetical protein